MVNLPLPSWAPTLETPRLILRLPQANDFDDYAQFLGDVECTRFLGGVQTRAQAWRAFATLAGAWHLYGFSMFTVVDKQTGKWAGRLGPWRPEGWPGTEVGWGIARAFQGRGYAVEGATAAMAWAREVLAWTDIIHCIDPANHASIVVAEKLGAVRIGRATLLVPSGEVIVDRYGYRA